ncbi:MAG: TSUP family transporter [Bacillota bacterium]
MFSELLITMPMFLFAIGACFLAGFIDSIAGGGGLISLPAYMMSGLPVHMAYGCNKFSSSFGTTIATYRYWKNKMVEVPVGIAAAIGAFLASWGGAKIVLFMNEETIRMMMIVVLPIVAIITLMNKNMGVVDESEKNPLKNRVAFGAMIGVVVGFYDGIVGPGAGTFAIMAFCFLMKYSLNTASGNAKFLNLASNYGAMIVFLLEGSVYFKVAIPCAVAGICGNILGSGFAIRYGAKGIRMMLIIVLVLLFINMGLDIFG